MAPSGSESPQGVGADFLLLGIQIAALLIDLTHLEPSSEEAARYRAASFDLHDLVTSLLANEKLDRNVRRKVIVKLTELETKLKGASSLPAEPTLN